MTSIYILFFRGGPQLGETEAGFLAAVVGAPLSVVLGGARVVVTAVVAATSKTLRNFDPDGGALRPSDGVH